MNASSSDDEEKSPAAAISHNSSSLRHSGNSSFAETTSDNATSASASSVSKNVRHKQEQGSIMSRPISTSTTATAIEAASPSNPKPSTATILCFSALTLSIFLVALDTVLIPTALPSISLDFHIPDSLYAWTGSAYLLANAASMPFWGKLSDVFGRKPIILIANSTFLSGSIICAVSVSATMLVGGRAVQGLGGGGVNVLVYICVADMFPICDRAFYMGIVGAMYAVASALGPVIGGVFAEKLNWRWCFYINLPLVSMAIVILYFTVRLHDPRTPFFAGIISIDWLGTFAILAATVLLLVGLQLGGTTTYNTPVVIVFLVLGPIAYIVFPFTQWWEEKRGGSPIMPLRIFRDVSNLSALGVCACDALVFNSIAYFFPLYFQLVLATSPSMSGLYMLAVAIPLALVSFLAGWIIDKTGRFLEVLQVGLTLMTVGVGLLITLTPTLELGKIIGFSLIVGLGFGPNFHAPLIALQTRVTDADMAAGTSAFGFVRMVSGAIGVVVGQVVFQLLMRPHLDDFADAGVDPHFAAKIASGEAISQASRISALPAAQKRVVKAGMGESLRGVWILFTLVSGLGLLISFGIKRTVLGREKKEARKQGRDGEVVQEMVNTRGSLCMDFAVESGK